MDDVRTSKLDGKPGIAYDHLGSGDVVLFLHGIGGNRTNWRDQLPHFAGRFHAVAWDTRGYGQSDDYDGPFDFADVADDLCRVLDHLDAPRAHLVGLSMGALIALDFSARRADRVTSMVLSGGRMTGDDRTPEQRAEFIRLRRKPLEEGKTPRDMAPAVAKTLLGPSATNAHFNRLVESMAALHVGSYIKAIEAVTRYEGWPDLGTIQTPTLLVYGEADGLNPPAIGRAGVAAMPHAEFFEIPDAGHLCNIESPAIFNEAVLSFLLQRK